MYGFGIIKGLWVTIRHFFGAMWSDVLKLLGRAPKPAKTDEGVMLERFPEPTLTGVFTVQYPEEKLPMVPRFRGPLMHLRDPETGQPRCTACGICIKACPHGCLSLEAEGKGKERHPKEYTYDLGCCIFCRQCVEACPFNAIELSRAYELASYGRDNTVWDLKKLLELGDSEEITEKDQYWV